MGPWVHTSAGGPDHGVRPLHRFVIAFDGIDSENELHLERIVERATSSTGSVRRRYISNVDTGVIGLHHRGLQMGERGRSGVVHECVSA